MRIVKALAALVALVAIVAGIPAVLVVVADPTTSSLWSDPVGALLAPDDGTALIGVLSLIAWATWAYLAAAVVVEAIAAVRGLQAPQVRGLAAGQVLVRPLVSAIALLIVAAPVLGSAHADAAPASAPTGHVALVDQEPTAQAPAAPAAAPEESVAAADPAGTEYTVKPGDSLWTIAAEHYGSGEQYPKIVAANPSVDGGRFLQPGEKLLLPDVDPAPAVAASYTVEPGDTLSAIADAELGDASQWPEIFAANRDQISNPDLIFPDQELELPVAGDPPAAEATPRPQAVPEAVPHIETAPEVVPDAQSAPEAAPQAEAAPEAVPGAQDAPETAPQAEAAPAEPPAAADARPEAREDLSGAQAGVDALADPETGSAASPASEDDPDLLTESSIGWPQVTAGGVGAVLAAGLIALIVRRRRAQEQARRPGARIAMPDPAIAATETQLRQIADPLSVESIDTALRSLALDHATNSRPLPRLRAARLTAGQLDLFLDEPDQLPAPWTGTADATVWSLHAQDLEALDPDAAASIPAPFPALVTVGTDADGGHVFVDLEYVGSMAVLGEIDDVREILAALAIELAVSSWADDLQVTLVGAYAELEGAMSTGRIRYLPTLAAAVEDLRSRAVADREALEADQSPDLQHARISGAAPDAWSPEIVVVATELSDAQRDEIDALVATLPRVALAAITTHREAGQWALDLTTANEAGAAVLEPFGLQVMPQRVDDATYANLLEIVATTSDPATEPPVEVPVEPTLEDLHEPVAAPTSEPAPTPQFEVLQGAADTEADATAAETPAVIFEAPALAAESGEEPVAATADAVETPELVETPEPVAPVAASAAEEPPAEDGSPLDTTAAGDSSQTTAPSPEAVESAAVVHSLPTGPRILVLGSPEMTGAAGSVEPTKAARLLEYAAYLALHPGASAQEIDEAIWPTRKTEANLNTRNTATSKLRSWLGKSAEGEEYLPRHQRDGYRLVGVSTDLDTWRELLDGDPFAATTPALEAALELVRGRPFTGRHARYYAWAEDLRVEYSIQISDAAFELARRRLMDGRWRAAEAAATSGLLVNPVDERLWRLRILAVHESGDREAEAAAVERLITLTTGLEVDLDPQTEDLLAALKSSPTSALVDLLEEI